MSPTRLIVALGMALATPESPVPQQVRIPVSASREVDLGALVARLAEATGRTVARPPGPVALPITGPAGALTRRLLAESLGPDASLDLQDGELVITLDPGLLDPDRVADWQRRLDQLAARADARGEAAPGIRDARPEVVPAQRPGAADGLPGARHELVVGGVRAHDPAARGGGLRGRRLRLSLQSPARGVVRAVPPRLARRSAARGARRVPGRSWRTRWGRWWRVRTSRTPRHIAGDVST